MPGGTRSSQLFFLCKINRLVVFILFFLVVEEPNYVLFFIDKRRALWHSGFFLTNEGPMEDIGPSHFFFSGEWTVEWHSDFLS